MIPNTLLKLGFLNPALKIIKSPDYFGKKHTIEELKELFVLLTGYPYNNEIYIVPFILMSKILSFTKDEEVNHFLVDRMRNSLYLESIPSKKIFDVIYTIIDCNLSVMENSVSIEYLINKINIQDLPDLSEKNKDVLGKMVEYVEDVSLIKVILPYVNQSIRESLINKMERLENEKKLITSKENCKKHHQEEDIFELLNKEYDACRKFALKENISFMSEEYPLKNLINYVSTFSCEEFTTYLDMLAKKILDSKCYGDMIIWLKMGKKSKYNREMIQSLASVKYIGLDGFVTMRHSQLEKQREEVFSVRELLIENIKDEYLFTCFLNMQFDKGINNLEKMFWLIKNSENCVLSLDDFLLYVSKFYPEIQSFEQEMIKTRKM